MIRRVALVFMKSHHCKNCITMVKIYL